MGLSTVSTFKNINNNNDSLKHLTDTQLKQLQETILSIVDDIDFVCKKHNINYNLGGGSCLGAVRHKGFIPWDDDFDINMPREDYNKFIKVFPEEMSNKYWFHTPEKNSNKGLGFARVRKKGTVFKAREDQNNDECGIYVDIFIIENTFNFFLARYFHGFLSLAMGFLLSCRNFYANRKFYIDLVKNDYKTKLKFKIKIFIGFLLSFLTIAHMTRTWNRINRMCKNNRSKYISVPVGRNHFFGELYKREDFCNVIIQEFSGRKLPICKEYDKYLTHMYGDYMKIPDKKDIETHIYLDLKF